jgi:zona occludens toxin
MIYLITGLPGASKTLYSLDRVSTDPQLIGREVHQYGIPDLQLPWVPLQDPKKWFNLPDGSVVVIDEAQKVFPLRATGSAVPPHVSEFETHRHKNMDVVLITQDAKLIDSHVRKLVERHFHLKRPFGLDYAVCLEFHGVGEPENGTMVKQALKTRFKHPKHLFGKYRSASGHSVKKRVPLKLFLLPILLAGAAFLGVTTYGRLANKTPEVAESAKEKASEGVQAEGKPAVAASAPGGNNALPRDRPSYEDMFTPRNPTKPESAPIYDALVASVKAIPRRVGCIQTNKDCTCWSQQATIIETPLHMCSNLVKYGIFNPYKNEENPSSGNTALASAPVITSSR